MRSGKTWCRVLLIVTAVLMCCVPRCLCAEVMEKQWESIDTDELERAASSSGVTFELNEAFDLNRALGDLRQVLAERLSGAVKASVGSGAVLLLIVLFCEVTQALGTVGEKKQSPVALVGAVAVAAVSLADVTSLMGLGKEAVSQINAFSNLLIPVITTCSAASGSVTGAAARQIATVFFSDVLVTLMDRLLIPFVYLYCAACAAAATVGNRGLGEIAQLIKWAVTSLLTVLLLLFTGYLSLTSIAASGADAATIKLTRTVISSMIPVVGSILSNATETVLSGVSVLKNIVGSFGVVAVLAFCITPFLRLGIQYLVYRLVAVLSAVLSEGKVPDLIGEIADAFALVLGMTGTAALLVMISIFSTLAVAVQ